MFMQFFIGDLVNRYPHGSFHLADKLITATCAYKVSGSLSGNPAQTESRTEREKPNKQQYLPRHCSVRHFAEDHGMKIKAENKSKKLEEKMYTSQVKKTRKSVIPEV